MILGILKQRKKTIDIIYRASCAMKAAAIVRVRKVEKYLSDFQKCAHILETHTNYLLEQALLQFAMNKNSQNKLDILISCDKGMCGDFLNIVNNYYKFKKDNGNYWLLLGAKLEGQGNDEKHIFLGNTFFAENQLLQIVSKIWEIIQSKEIIELNLHYLSLDKIVVNTIFSAQRMQTALQANINDNLTKEKINDHIPWHMFGKFVIAQILYKAMLESLLAENKQRLIAMSQAKTNAEDMGKMIARLYNKARQEKITMELSEITAGII